MSKFNSVASLCAGRGGAWPRMQGELDTANFEGGSRGELRPGRTQGARDQVGPAHACRRGAGRGGPPALLAAERPRTAATTAGRLAGRAQRRANPFGDGAHGAHGPHGAHGVAWRVSRSDVADATRRLGAVRAPRRLDGLSRPQSARVLLLLPRRPNRTSWPLTPPCSSSSRGEINKNRELAKWLRGEGRGNMCDKRGDKWYSVPGVPAGLLLVSAAAVSRP